MQHRHSATVILFAKMITCALPSVVNADEVPGMPSGIPAAQASDLNEKIQKFRKKYGADMRFEVDTELKLLFVMGVDQRSTDEVKTRLSAHAAALQRDLFQHKPESYLSVIVPKKWANPKVTGHFWPDFVDASTTGSSLMHEFTHVLHYADQVGRNQFHPIWIMEGLASMFEHSEVVSGHVVPKHNRRLAKLQEEVKNGKFLPLPKMMGLERRRFTSHHYAQACYMSMYLHDTGKLPEWYAVYNAGFAKDPSGVNATEKVYAKSIGEVEADWVKWVLDLPTPMVGPAPGSPSLGIGATQIPDAVEINALSAGGCAEQAGLKVGDALIRVDGERVIEIQDLVNILGRKQQGDTVEIEFRRDGNYDKTRATLTALAVSIRPKPAQR